MSPFHSIPNRIVEAAKVSADRVALKTPEKEASYSRLITDALGVAQIVAGHCRPGDRVGIMTGDQYLTYCAIIGTWFAGCAYVPLHRANPALRNSEIIAGAGIALLLAAKRTDSAESAAAGQRIPYVVLDHADLKQPRTEPVTPGEDDLAYILYTSGSTGAPKGVPISHGNLAAFLDSWSADPSFGLTAEDRVLQMFELSFDLSVMSIVAALTSGAACHVVPNEGIHYLNIARVLQEEDITFAMFVPSVLSYLKRYFDEIRLPALRHSMFAGEVLLTPLVTGWRQCAPNAVIQNSYGPTETTIICTIYDCSDVDSIPDTNGDIVPIGFPMPGNEVVLLDETGQPLQDGSRGELALIGPQVMQGYWHNEEKNRQAFARLESSDGTAVNAYRSGDIVSRDGTGCLHWHMRQDSQVKIDGHRVELGEIEARARRIASTPNVAVICREDLPGYPRLELFYDDSEVTEERLSAALVEALPPYMQPRIVKRMPALPLNPNGKIDRKALASM